MIELILPYPPSANRLWSRTGRGMRRSDRYEKWLNDAGFLAQSQVRAQAIVGTYKIGIHAVRPDKRRRDLDNIIKPISDLLQHIGVIGDDCNCEMLTARWVTDGDGVVVRLEPVGVE